MGSETTPWPYAPTLLRLALAMGLGLFIGIERERRRKEAGLRTFAFASMLGGVGGLLDDRFALVALALLGILVVLLNIETIHTGEGAEITTSAALLLTGYIGILAGKGHTFTPTALAIATAGLLAWKEPLAGFSRALTESEFRSAVAALRFGLLFLGFQVAGAIAERLLGSFGFYAVSIAAGMVSSASAVASAATLASSHTLPVEVAATGAVLASMASAAVNFPILSRVAQHRALTRNVATVLWITGVLGVIGLVIMRLVAGVAFRPPSG